MKITKVLALLLLAALLFSLSACGSAGEAAEKSEAAAAPAESGNAEEAPAEAANDSAEAAHITLGRVGTGLGGLDAAYLNGDFAAAGLDVERISFSSGSDAVAALISGDIDLFLGSYEHVLRQLENGLDIRAYALIANRQSYQLVTKTDAPYQSLTDLKGANVGVTKAGSQSDSVLRKILREAGVDPETEVEIINGGTGATIVAALDSGSVDAAMVSDPTVSELLASGEYRILHNPDYETAGLVLVAKTDWAKQNAEAFRTLLKVIKTENGAIAEKPEDFLEIFRTDYPDLDEGVLLQAIKNNTAITPADLKLTQAAADEVQQTQLEQGTVKNEYGLDQTYDESYLPE